MKQFLTHIARFVFIGSIPITILLLAFILLDPFKVVKKYDAYFEPFSTHRIWINKDVVSTNTFLNNKEKGINYDSFIFGNSRSVHYNVADWQSHLHPNANAYHFDASSEVLLSMAKKVRLIDKEQVKIKNALLVLDFETLSQKVNRDGHIFVPSPQLFDNKTWVKFYLTEFNAFISPSFLSGYLSYLLFQDERSIRFVDKRPMTYDVAHNEIKFLEIERSIAADKYYTEEHIAKYYKRNGIERVSKVAITDFKKKLFLSMDSVFKKHNTNVQIIISPLYDQIKLNPEDVNYLKRLFGADHVHDYSGVNEITNELTNYYEISHYRPHVARQILNDIYQNK